MHEEFDNLSEAIHALTSKAKMGSITFDEVRMLASYARIREDMMDNYDLGITLVIDDSEANQ